MNEISKPVRSNKGFHIIKIDEEQTFFTTPYKEAEQELKREILGRKQDKSREQYLQLIQDLKWKYRVRVDSSNVDLLIKKVEEAVIERRKTQNTQNTDEFNLISSDEQNLNIANYKGGVLKIDEELINHMAEDIKKIRSETSAFRGTEAVIKLNEEVKQELSSIKKVELVVEKHADKVEDIFVNMQKKFNEFQ